MSGSVYTFWRWAIRTADGGPFDYAGAVGRHQRAQSLIEFALTIGAFLIVLFGALSTALYAVQRSAAVTAAAAGARAAASAQPGNPNAVDLPAAGPAVTSRLSPVLFGSKLAVKPPGVPCDNLAVIQPGDLQLCAINDPADPGMVIVEVRGKPQPFVPLVPLPWTIDAPAEVHAVTFSR